MMNRHAAGIESAAAVLRHPMHPLLVTLPITAFVGVFCCDFVNLFVYDPFWSLASFWLLIAGAVTGIVAAAFGFIDYMTLSGVRSLEAAQVHAIGNVTVLIIALCNLGIRWYEPTRFFAWYIILSAATVGLLMITGWIGGGLVYKHRIGQIASEHGGENLARHIAE